MTSGIFFIFTGRTNPIPYYIMNTKILLGILLLSTFSLAWSQKSIEPQVELKSSDVDKFISSYPAIKADFEQHGYEIGISNDFDAFVASLEGYEEGNTLVQKHGYADFTEWISITWTIVVSYAAIMLEEIGMPEYQEALRAIDNDSTLTPEQKEISKEKLSQVMAAIESGFQPVAVEGNRQVIQPYLQPLKNLFIGD